MAELVKGVNAPWPWPEPQRLDADKAVKALADYNCALCRRGEQLYVHPSTREYLHADHNHIEMIECDAGVSIWSEAQRLGVKIDAITCTEDN